MMTYPDIADVVALAKTAKYVCNEINRSRSREQRKLDTFKEVKMNESDQTSGLALSGHMAVALDKLSALRINIHNCS